MADIVSLRPSLARGPSGVRKPWKNPHLRMDSPLVRDALEWVAMRKEALAFTQKHAAAGNTHLALVFAKDACECDRYIMQDVRKIERTYSARGIAKLLIENTTVVENG